MNISFIALNISGAETVQSAADNVRGILSSFGRCDFKLCGSMSQVSSSLTDAFANADIIAIGVEPSVYSKSKLAILRAMHIKTEINTTVKNLIGSKNELDSQQISSHCAMPVGASVFMSSDGLFSGFAIKSGKQHFVLLPLDKLRLDSVISKGLVPYFENAGIKANKHTEEEKRIENCITKAAGMLREHGKKIYFASTPSCAIIKNLCGDEPIEDVMVFSDYTAKRGSEAPRSYIADLARYSIPNGETALGAAISNVFTGTSQETGEQKYNIYVAVSDQVASRVLRFASQTGETPEELVNAAVEMLMDMICDKCVELPEEQTESEKPFVSEPIEMIEEEPDEEVTKKKRRGVRIVAYVAIALIAALVVLFVYKGFDNANQTREKAKTVFAEYAVGAAANSDSSVIAIEEFEITVDTNKWASRPAQTESVLEPVITNEEAEETEKPEEETLALSTENLKTTAPTVTIKNTTTAATEKATGTSAVKSTTTLKTTAPTSTTAKVTTTVKKTTTTQKPTTTAAQANGNFVFTTYGYGHGVGMSQEGALAYAKQGMDYSSILLHYYPGTKLEKSDSAMPQTVKFGGVDYPLVQYLCCSVAAEIGEIKNAAALEAIKAQTVAIYSYSKCYNFNVNSSLHAFKQSYAYSGTLIEMGVKAVLGQYLSYNGKPARTMFYAMSAGKTTTASTVWGGTSYPYLEKRVESPYDKNCTNYKVTYTISAKDIQKIIKANIGVDLTGDPKDWFTIIEHDDAVSSSIGYVNKMTVGGKTISGAAFRNTAMGYRLRSHCFTVKYVEQ